MVKKNGECLQSWPRVMALLGHRIYLYIYLRFHSKSVYCLLVAVAIFCPQLLKNEQYC